MEHQITEYGSCQLLIGMSVLFLRMYAAVDVPKSKQITIAYLSLKTTCISWLLMSTLTSNSPGCSTVSQAEMYSLFILFYKLGFILDLVTVIYFLLKDYFSPLQFYVYYIAHLIAITAMGIALLLVPVEEFDSACPIFTWVRNGCFFMRIIFFMQSVGVMWMNLYTVLRLAHCGVNLLWSALWLIVDTETMRKTKVFGQFHGIVGVGVVVVVGLVEIIGKVKLSVLIWRTSIKLISFGLFVLWIYSFTVITQQQTGEALYINVYTKLGLLELVSPVLYLTFMNTENGDPRERLMASYDDIFVEGREGYTLKYEEVR